MDIDDSGQNSQRLLRCVASFFLAVRLQWCATRHPWAFCPDWPFSNKPGPYRDAIHLFIVESVVIGVLAYHNMLSCWGDHFFDLAPQSYAQMISFINDSGQRFHPAEFYGNGFRDNRDEKTGNRWRPVFFWPPAGEVPKPPENPQRNPVGG